MYDNKLILFDRVNVIKDTINKYGQENFYLSFSGGKDSTILHYLLDMALPNNNIPRVFIDTGIEYVAIRDFINELSKKDNRIEIIKPTKPIIQTLKKVGYPFKSKQHSQYVKIYQNSGICLSVKRYLGLIDSNTKFRCPKSLLYQFTPKFNIKLSDKCCLELKKKPIHNWERLNKRFVAITGMRKSEGGERASIKGCILTDKNGNLKKFHPLLVVDDEWEEWFVKENNIKLCELYYPPYNFKRTGCAGCPFNIKLHDDLECMSRLLPLQRQQCEIIWKPVYDEYRRLNYRLRKVEQIKLL